MREASASGVSEQRRATGEQERQERKARIQNDGRSSTTRSIAKAVVIKEGDIFFLTETNGDVPLGGEHGFGLYYHDCRYLNGYEVKLGDAKPELLASTAVRGFMALLELTNPDMKMDDGALRKKDEIGIQWKRVIESSKLRLDDVFSFRNHGQQQITFPFVLTFQTEFEPLFSVRGMTRDKLGHLHSPNWTDGSLNFSYDGADGVYRALSVHLSPEPQSSKATTAGFNVSLDPGEEKQILVSLCIEESKDRKKIAPKAPAPVDIKKIEQRLRGSSDECLGSETEVSSDSILLNTIMERSLRDLHLLKTKIAGEEFFAAGVPWFVALFGRDSLIASLQMLAYDAGIAEQTLRLLAKYQGQKQDDWRDEEPGKIMHELRVGEMAHLNEIPQTPYYGTIDATPLFLILIARHAAWTGELRVFNDLRENVEAALKWIANSVARNDHGYLQYQSASKKGLANQGWKDSGDSIVNHDGSLANPPISLVEVQGYVYLAKVSLADLYERAGETDRATELRHEAQALRERFNQDFWVDQDGFYALALQACNKPAAVISSNPGQALWTGIVDPANAKRVVSRLMAPDMFSGWGIRTLSAQESRYNPIGYHLGTVWPHDNSLIAAAFRRYGFSDEICQVFTGITEAAMHFAHHRLPEVFAGFCKHDYEIPVHYPVACHPQAWAAGSVPYLLESALGLQPEAFDRRLRIIDPILPQFVSHLVVRRLKVGSGSAELSFDRSSDGAVSVKVLNVRGKLDVVVEPNGKQP